MHRQAQVVGAVQRLRLQPRLRRRFRQRRDLHVARPGIALGQAGLQSGEIRAGRQQPQLQRHGQHDALAERAIRRQEHGPLRQARMALDFRRVLVRQAQTVDLERRLRRRVRPFVGVHAGAPPPE